MKRFHVHVSVSDLERSIGFYSKLFAAAPSVRKDDYAKWMLEDPRVNFAISQRGAAPGLDHLGLQVDSGEELKGLAAQLRDADATLLEEAGTGCCYATSDKYWVTDPQGLAWETFHTLGEIPTFSAPAQDAPAAACCAPTEAAVAMPSRPKKAAAACC